ncbi:uncharacterized protein LOC129756875 [Uranotaenia lowii]|uniref:uncharacterized protein LOC129756875 n=1 Tax=Uranotaenia lowii TaxID=190385 RepID=UPI00247888C3|nr:uncharacterized protein LOC129756875 [Uranotaenia lowii]
MVGWKFRGTFPSLWSQRSETLIDHEDVRERDAEAKLKDKIYADSARGAAESNIDVGDTVLMAQPRRKKTDPTFSKERFKVLARHGAKVVIASQSGIQYCRKVDDVKKAPVQISNTTAADEEDLGNSEPVFTELQQGQEQSSTANKVGTRQQQGCIIQRPSKYDDYFVYCVFN